MAETPKWINAELELRLWASVATSALRGPDVLVLLTLGTYADRTTLSCWPSLRQVAERSRLDLKTVRSSIRKLASSGLLTIKRRDGAPFVFTLTPTESGTTGNGTPTESGTTGNGRGPLPDPGGEGYRKREGTPTGSGTRTSREQERVQERGTFALFWEAFPKKERKKLSSEKWDEALEEGHDPEVIIAGAIAYAVAREGEDPHYTKGPAGWLSDERWTDEAAAVRPAYADDQKVMRAGKRVDQWFVDQIELARENLAAESGQDLESWCTERNLTFDDVASRREEPGWWRDQMARGRVRGAA